MFEFMDGIVDAVEEFGQVAVFVMIGTAKVALIITAPVWILPYVIWRKGRKQ